VRAGAATSTSGLGFRFVSYFLSFSTFSVSRFFIVLLQSTFVFRSFFLFSFLPRDPPYTILIGSTDYNKLKPYFPVSGSRVVSKIVNPTSRWAACLAALRVCRTTLDSKLWSKNLGCSCSNPIPLAWNHPRILHVAAQDLKKLIAFHAAKASAIVGSVKYWTVMDKAAYTTPA
jgi:hypothetical protein